VVTKAGLIVVSD